jgi:hypothetical protein
MKIKAVTKTPVRMGGMLRLMARKMKSQNHILRHREQKTKSTDYADYTILGCDQTDGRNE